MSVHVMGESAPYIPDVSGCTTALDYALAYAAAGLYVLPVLKGEKKPGSVVGSGWPEKSSRSSADLYEWFGNGTDYGIALHAGRSGLFVVDIDHPELVTPEMQAAIGSEPHPIQLTRTLTANAHHIFRMPERILGNGVFDGGDFRGLNGVIIVAPSVHQKAGDSNPGLYYWLTTGAIPVVPESIARLVTDGNEYGNDADAKTVKEFFRQHTQASDPRKLKAVVKRYNEQAVAMEGGGNRHAAMRDALRWGMKEARQGLYPAQLAYDEILAAHELKMIKGENRISAKDNVNQTLPWALARALEDSPEELAAHAAGRAERLEASSALDKLTGGRTTPTGAHLAAVPTLADLGAPEGAEQPEPEADDFVPSWRPVDMTEFVNGTYAPVVPTLLPRADGQCLLYAGKVHSFHGESESGKSWIAQIEAARLLSGSGRVAIIDYESDGGSVANRLMLLGVPRQNLLPEANQLHYMRPEAAPWSLSESEDWDNLLAEKFDLVILDGVTEALTTLQLSSNDNDELTGFIRRIPRKIAQSTGAAVVMVDHVVKSREDGGRFAIGGQAKMAALDGAAYVVEIGTKPLGKGRIGEIIMRLAKDREGSIRGATSGAYRKSDRTQEIARVSVDSTSEYGITARVDMPNVGQAADENDGSEMRDLVASRPFDVMEAMSRFIEIAPSAPSKNILVKDRSVSIDGSQRTREVALGFLLKEGFIAQETGGNRSQVHKSVKPYRKDTDELFPLSILVSDTLDRLVGQGGA